jgi:hypothetical protein
MVWLGFCVIAAVIAMLLALLTACGDKRDLEVGWHEIEPHRDAPIRGFEIGSVTVPGHTQRVRFYMWGIPKDDDLADEDPYIFGEMDRGPSSELGALALAAYNHGGMRIILSGPKAYVVTSDEEQELFYEVEHAQ